MNKLAKFALFSATIAAAFSIASATELDSARVTQVVKEVKLLPKNASARPAQLSEDVRKGTAVSTGTDSRAELTFTDQTLARLGANTLFSFEQGTRDLNLNSGAVLVQVPRNAPAAKVTTAAVTAAITGGTALFETHKKDVTKLLVLEGVGTLCPKGGKGNCYTARQGEMLVMDQNGHITPPIPFNVQKVVNTSKLLIGFKPLPNIDLINNTIVTQQTTQQNAPPSGNNNNNHTDTLSQHSASAQPSPPGFACPFPSASPSGAGH